MMRSALNNQNRTAGIALAALFLGAAFLPLSGCGGGSHPAAPGLGASREKVGAISFSVEWPKPDPSRLIPRAANSIQLRLFQGATEIAAPVVLNKPASFTTGQTQIATAAFAGLSVGTTAAPITYRVTATAFPSIGAVGVPQASGQTASTDIQLTLTAPAVSVPLTMNSTIAKIVVSPAVQDMRVGDTVTLAATALDAAGSVVLTTPSQIQWTLGSPAIGTIVTPGNPVTFTGRAIGTTSATARDAESGISSATPATLNVISTGLALSSWPKFHGNVRNTGLATVGAAIATTPSNRPGWPFSIGSSIELSSPAIGANNTVYIGANDGKLYAFQPDGSLKWSFPTGGQIQSAPIVGINGVVYVGSLDGKLYAVRDKGTSGALAWSQPFDAGGSIFGSPTMDRNGFIYVGTTATVGTTGGQSVYCVDSLNGVKKWGHGLTSECPVSPALNAAEDSVFVAASDGTVFSLNASSGVERWNAPLSATYGGTSFYSSSPVVGTSGGVETLYVTSQQGLVFGLNPASGILTWLQPFDLQAQVFGTPALSAGRFQALCRHLRQHLRS